jgi:hypothetical protein
MIPVVSMVSIGLAIGLPQEARQLGPDLNNRQLQNLQLVAVARFQGFLGWYETPWLTQEGSPHNPADPYSTAEVARYRFRVELPLVGNPPRTVELLEAERVKFSGQPEKFGPTWGGGGPLFLIYGFAPDSRGIHWTFCGVAYNFQVQHPHQYLSLDGNAISLPDIRYVLEGDTLVEKLASILVQGYCHNPDDTWCRNLLYILRKVVPSWKLENGQVVLKDPREDGPGFFQFARERLIPRLFRVAGDNILRRLRAMYNAYAMGDVPQGRAYQELLEELDRTWPNPEERGLIDGLLGNDQYRIAHLRARLVCIREEAVRTISLKPEYIQVILDVLVNDPSPFVQAEAVDWFNRLRSWYIREYLDAPVGRKEYRNGVPVILNREELIQYWSGR